MISSNSSAEQTGEDMPEVVAPDPAPRPVRRTFTAAYRLSMVDRSPIVQIQRLNRRSLSP